ncbi:MAG: hypothetical protein AAF485_23155, partial [Chloroflexota bacterium]
VQQMNVINQSSIKTDIMFEVLDESHFKVQGWLVDLVLIEYWSRHQGGDKVHQIRSNLSVLRVFTQTMMMTEADSASVEQTQRVVKALRKLAYYGYHIPSQIIN